MLGDSLLVAPVFKASGEVEYYLPEGKWINILTGDVKEGGSWQKEKHDYFSLPLMLRPNSILATGACDCKPDYEFAEGVKLCISEMTDGCTAETAVTDLRGKAVLHASAERQGDIIRLRVESSSTNWCYALLGDQNLTVITEQQTHGTEK